jgi:hypothetical protein
VLRFAVDHNKGLTLNAPVAHEAHVFSLVPVAAIKRATGGRG